MGDKPLPGTGTGQRRWDLFAEFRRMRGDLWRLRGIPEPLNLADMSLQHPTTRLQVKWDCIPKYLLACSIPCPLIHMYMYTTLMTGDMLPPKKLFHHGA